MILDLKGKKAIVCGSTQGIGRASAEALANMGATIVLIARNEDSLKKVKASLNASHGQRHDYICADYSFPAELKVAVENYMEEKGPVHILINNTGGPPGGPALEAKADEFVHAFHIHLVCNHILAQAVVPGMKEAGFGRIINIISTSVKQPIRGLGVSNTIRAAVGNWSKTLSLELASFGITVNNVLPGATETARISSLLDAKSKKTGHTVEQLRKEMLEEIPAGRFAKAEEIANAVAFLASPAASYITGVNVPVDGGRTGCL